MTPEAAEAVRDALVDMVQGEHTATCQALAAVTDAGKTYRPDPKSRTPWDIATHIATADIWLIDSIVAGAFHLDPEVQKQILAKFKTADALVAFYRAAMPKRLAALKALQGEQLTRTLDFFGMMQMPAVSFIGFVNNHSVHHRGQFSASLRAIGGKVPNLYGPSADAEPAK